MGRKYFGTDGIRGRVGETPINAEFALRLGRAVGVVLGKSPSRTVLIGKDTRISGYMFESALEAGLSAAGANIKLLGPMPTPAIAYLTRTLRASAGIVISASHNPYFDNGFKFFSASGEKLADADELAIEAELAKPFVTVAADRLGKAQRVDDASERYIEFCKSTVETGTSLAGLKIVVDCAHGATYQVGPRTLGELGAEVVAIGVAPDGLNINQECGSTHLAALQQAVIENQADVGVAFDGDGDRVLMVDERGQAVDGDQMLFVMARARQRNGRLSGGVVGTLMSNLGLHLALDKIGIAFERARVGDRFVHRKLIQRGWNLGGEASGHLLCLDKTTTGDGIVSALEVLEVMVKSDQPLSELTADMSRLPQIMINVPGRTGVAELEDSAPVQSALRQVQAELGERGRVILRPSGTEPVVRVTLEGPDADQVKRLSKQLAAVVLEQFGDS